MRIGEDNNFLSIERPDEWPFEPFRVTAHVTGGGMQFRCRHERIVFDTSDETQQALSDFQDLAVHFAEIPASESGWLRLSRDAHGQIAVSYRLASQRLAAALEGKVTVSGEFADRFCTELRAFLKDH